MSSQINDYECSFFLSFTDNDLSLIAIRRVSKRINTAVSFLIDNIAIKQLELSVFISQSMKEIILGYSPAKYISEKKRACVGN
jgi:hypothetical protein